MKKYIKSLLKNLLKNPSALGIKPGTTNFNVKSSNIILKQFPRTLRNISISKNYNDQIWSRWLDVEFLNFDQQFSIRVEIFVGKLVLGFINDKVELISYFLKMKEKLFISLVLKNFHFMYESVFIFTI